MKHDNRLSSAIAGRTKMDAGTEKGYLAIFTPMEKEAKKTMINHGQQVGPIWDWLIGIRGIGAHTAAKLLALFDDPGKFATISKWRRYAGWGLFDYWQDENGKLMAPKIGDKMRKNEEGRHVRYPVVAEPKPGWTLVTHRDVPIKGWCLSYNKQLKCEGWLVGESFIKQQTPLYTDIYYEEKARLRAEHPEPEPTSNGGWPTKYTKSHIDRMAKRKMIKLFLSHFWVEWRTLDGLPVTLPYVLAHTERHSHYIEALAQDRPDS
jgi:hypothetical protein